MTQQKKNTLDRPPKINGRAAKTSSTVVLSDDKTKVKNTKGQLKLKENLET